MSDPEQAARSLIRLGVHFERATQRRDFDEMIRIERAITARADADPDTWTEMWIIRGRNLIRSALGQEPLHV